MPTSTTNKPKRKPGRPRLKSASKNLQWYRWARDFGLSRDQSCALSGLTVHQGRLQDVLRSAPGYVRRQLPAGFTADVIASLKPKEQRVVVVKGSVRSAYLIALGLDLSHLDFSTVEAARAEIKRWKEQNRRTMRIRAKQRANARLDRELGIC